MSKIAEMLPKEMLAAIAAMVNGTEGAEVAAKQQSEDRPIAKGSGFHLIRLLNNKSYDDNEVVVAEDGEVVVFEDDSAVTFGDLRNTVSMAEKADGSSYRNYELVWGLTQGQASGAISWLEAKNAKPRNNSATPNRRRTQSSNSATPNQADIERVIAAAVAAQLAAMGVAPEPAKPVAVAGHRKLAQPAKPVDGPNYQPGDVITVNGIAVQISADGKRLNKTIVAE